MPLQIWWLRWRREVARSLQQSWPVPRTFGVRHPRGYTRQPRPHDFRLCAPGGVASMSTRDQGLSRLTSLNVNRSQGDPAPHKPLLLLSILTRLDEGEPLPELLPLLPELAFRFQTLWA